MPWAGPSRQVYDEVGSFIDRLVAGHPTYENATDRTATDDGESDGRSAKESGPSETDDAAFDGGTERCRRS
jgi:hypothetical protein